MRRIWAFVKQKVGLSVPAAVTIHSPTKPPAAVPDKTLADAWVRISERQRKKATTATTLAQAQDNLSNLHGDAAKRLVLRVTTSTATTWHVRAVDVLSAKVSKLRDLPLCDPAGELIPSTKSARRSRILLTDVLSGTVELLPLPKAAKPDSNPVIPTADGEIQPAKHSVEAAKYELSPETNAEAVSPSEYPP